MAASTKGKKRGSGNPEKRVSTAKAWKRNKGEELELPSGNVALVRRPGPQSLLGKGILPDTLMPIVQQAIRSGKGLKPQETADMLQDEQTLIDMMDGMDKLLVEVVVEPTVAYHKRQVEGGGWEEIPQDERDEDTIYTDEVDEEDKMFVFNYAVGGTRDLEQFRREQAARVGDLSNVSGNENSPESTDQP